MGTDRFVVIRLRQICDFRSMSQMQRTQTADDGSHPGPSPGLCSRVHP